MILSNLEWFIDEKNIKISLKKTYFYNYKKYLYKYTNYLNYLKKKFYIILF